MIIIWFLRVAKFVVYPISLKVKWIVSYIPGSKMANILYPWNPYTSLNMCGSWPADLDQQFSKEGINKTKLCYGTASLVHIFNVWTIIIKSLIEYKGMKTVGATDYTMYASKRWCRHICLSSTPQKYKKIFMKHAQNRRCTSSMCEQSLCKDWI